MNITIKTIPHKEQRYDTYGDWWYEENGDVQIRVSKFADWRVGFLIALHEFVEIGLCKLKGITQKQVDDYDLSHPEIFEPGDEPDCPYAWPHQFAMNIERLTSHEFGFIWKPYYNDIEPE